MDNDFVTMNEPLSLGKVERISMITFNSSTKELGRVTRDGEIVINATESELQEMIAGNMLGPFPILLLEILRLRKLAAQ